MRTEVYLIRHGEVENPKKIIYGRTVDVSLNEAGFKQLEDLGKSLKSEGVVPMVI